LPGFAEALGESLALLDLDFFDPGVFDNLEVVEVGNGDVIDRNVDDDPLSRARDCSTGRATVSVETR
jgi:hypothetical protein